MYGLSAPGMSSSPAADTVPQTAARTSAHTSANIKNFFIASISCPLSGGIVRIGGIIHTGGSIHPGRGRF